MHAPPPDLEVDDPTLSPAERSRRLGWLSALHRPGGFRPVVGPGYVARQGRALRVVDIRPQAALLGPMGHVPGVDWIPLQRASTLHERVGPYEPLVVVCEDGARSMALAAWLEAAGLRMVAAMEGGMQGWRAYGLLPARDPALVDRGEHLSELTPLTGSTSTQPFSLAEITEHVGNPRSVRWLKMAAFLMHGHMACVDGRDATAVVGSPGGDAGELVLALGALETLLGAPLPDPAVDALVSRRVDAFGHFGFHTDVHAGDRMIAAIRADPRTAPYVDGVSDFVAFRQFFNAPPAGAREALAQIMVQPQHIGCGHLRLCVQQATRWGVRAGLTQRVLHRALHLRWEGLHEVELTPLPGGHNEGAVLNVRVAEPMHGYAYVPLVAPSIAGRQLFVNHPDAAGYLRRQLARWLSRQHDLFRPPAPEALGEAIAALHQVQLDATLRALAPGLPVFDVVMHREGAAQVTPRGQVPT